MQLQRTDEQTDPFHGRGRPTAIALDNTNMSSSHSLAAGPLASSFRANRNCNCCRFSSWQAFGLRPPCLPGPSSLFVAVLRDGRTGRKVNRPQRQVEVKLKSAAAGDATGDDKPGRVLDKQAEREYERELNLVRCTFTLAIETTARERRSRIACMTHQNLQSEKR